MTDILGGGPSGLLRSREIANGEFAPEVCITDSATNSGLFFSTDNEMLVATRSSLLRLDATGASDSVLLAFPLGSGTLTTTNGIWVEAPGATPDSGYVVQTGYAVHYPGTTGYFVGVFQMGDAGAINNGRHWGYFDANNGFGFGLSGTTFGVFTRTNGTETFVPYTSCNGVTSNFNPATDLLKLNQYTILHGAMSSRWQINGRTIHSIPANTLTAPLTISLTLPMRFDTLNTGGGTSNSTITCRGMSYSRLSPTNLVARATTYTTAQTVTTVSYVPTRVVALNINTPAASVITLYDAVGLANSPLGVYTIIAGTQPFRIPIEYPTTTGLTITTSAAINCTILWE